MAFLKLRQKLTEEAQTEVEAARAAAARRATERAAREAAAAAAAREAAAQAAVAAVPSPRADGGRTRTLHRDFSGVAASLGLAELFGSDAEEEAAGSPSSSPAASPAAPAAPAGPAGPPADSADGGGAQPRLSPRDGTGVSFAAPPLPPAAAPALPATRPPLQLGAAAAAAATAAATPASAPSTARRSGQPASSRRPPRLRGFGRQDLKAFLEARGAGGWAAPQCLFWHFPVSRN